MIRGWRAIGATAGLGLAMACGSVAVAQVPEASPAPGSPAPIYRPLPKAQDPAAVMEQTLRQAEDWVRLHLPDRAIALLEPLHRDHPTDATINLMLAEAYGGAGRHLDAAALYRVEAESHGGEDPGLWIQLARAYERAGQGRPAVEALLECSRRRPDTTPHLLDVFQLLASDSLVGKEARSTLETAARAPDSPLAWSEIVAQSEALAGDGAQALALTLRLERRQSTGGLRLIQLAEALVRGSQPEVALAAYDSVAAIPTRLDRGEEALVDKGRLLETLSRWREAADAYAECERRYPSGTIALRGTLRRGDLLLSRLADPTGGRAAYASVLERLGRNPRQEIRGLRDEARLGVAECDLRSGELARADSAYASLVETGVSAEAREEAAFQRAELLFFQGRFGEAEEAYYQVTDKFPGGAWTNDALQRALLLGENAATQPALGPLAQALLQLRTGHDDQALALCEQGLAQFDSTTVGAELWRVKATLQARRGAWSEADSSLARLRAHHATSRAVPATLLALGKMAEGDPARRASARDYYERIVLDYPSSFEARMARAWFEARRSAGAAS